MANTDLAKSFRVLANRDWLVRPYQGDSGYAGQNGDPVSLDSAGRATDTIGTPILGIQDGLPLDASIPGDIVNTTASETATTGDKVNVFFELGLLFTGQLSTGLLTDPYTTRSKAAAYDLAGSAGAYYVDAAASSNDHVKVVAPWYELKSGADSAVGAYQKCIFAWVPATHFLGTIA